MKIKSGASKVRGQMRPLGPAQVANIETMLAQESDWRSLALFRVAIDSMLRASDLVALIVPDVMGSDGHVMEEIIVRQRKTGGTVRAVLSEPTREALKRWLAIRPPFWGEWVFTGKIQGGHLSDSQYRREAKRWFKMARLDTRFYSTHSLRRTKAALIFAKTGNIEVVRRLLGHATTNATSRYLGVEDADALKVAREIRI
jgi:integrase